MLKKKQIALIFIPDALTLLEAVNRNLKNSIVYILKMFAASEM
jgi:hypothetical protein